MNAEWYDMAIGETLTITDTEIVREVWRVPGGWVASVLRNHDGRSTVMSSCFVPYYEEHDFG